MMSNFKCKSHKSRSTTNKILSLCINEMNERILSAYATNINGKKENTIICIVFNWVVDNSLIWTDEHQSYSNLRNYRFAHDIVCHRYEFIKNSCGANTKAVESSDS
ncbi:hypothetical protein H312_00364 [Anncaliia algerae PRA339]|uniref:ISXO2-like transposase domain-containing protein n=1 Tax=Anncaliia algerae PRA339 TaxID=1288291 RepID=A0A059F5T8_9MICR|nr:hypothetical protein H312_00364 [Anncaliia algerae PRA339]